MEKVYNLARVAVYTNNLRKNNRDEYNKFLLFSSMIRDIYISVDEIQEFLKTHNLSDETIHCAISKVSCEANSLSMSKEKSEALKEKTMFLKFFVLSQD